MKILVKFLFYIALIVLVVRSEPGNFMLHRYSRENPSESLCLTFQTKNLESYAVHQPVLVESCNNENSAWKWKYLTTGQLKNVLLNRCLTAESNELNKDKEIYLEVCNENNKMQKWACWPGYKVVLPDFSSFEYMLSHRIVKKDGINKILLFVKYVNDKTDELTEYGWIAVKGSTFKKATICEYKQNAMMNIITVGGPMNSTACYFPFSYAGRQHFSCIKIPEKDFICATTYNLDAYPDSWGTCPSNWKNSVSKWVNVFEVCSKPCGGGVIYRYDTDSDGLYTYIKTLRVCNNQLCSGDSMLSVNGDSQLFAAENTVPLMSLSQGFGLTLGVCVFPFIFQGVKTESCISRSASVTEYGKTWCSLTENFDLHQRWGECLDEYKTSWSSWSQMGGSSCSRTCGGGQYLLSRRCRYPPCVGKSSKYGGQCNTGQCESCFKSKGELFQGETSVTNDQTTCQHWYQQSPKSHRKFDEFVYPELDNNYCRNPDEEKLQPYCYRNSDDAPDWMYCDLRPCTKNVSHTGIYFTVPDEAATISTNPPCEFPFIYRSFFFSTCVVLKGKQSKREMCRVTEAGKKTFAYCPRSLAGRWGEWSFYGDCTERCGGGKSAFHRNCLLEPCKGEQIKLNEKLICNRQLCMSKDIQQEDCFTGRGALYDGNVSRSITGRICMKWSDSPFHRHLVSANHTNSPDLIKNFCRNPDPSQYISPWCYVDVTTDSSSWEYCDISKCVQREGDIYGLLITGARSEHQLCKFPFYTADNRFVNSCQLYRAEYGSNSAVSYCALNSESRPYPAGTPMKILVNQGLRDGYYGICPPVTMGTWSSWYDDGSCSKVCGGGLFTKIKYCRHDPCEENQKKKIDQTECNTHQCLNCLHGNGKFYTGTNNRGGKCLFWPDKPSPIQLISKQDYLILNENFCRNPDGIMTLPWCYEGESKNRVYCELNHCEDDLLRTIPYTFSTSETNQSLPCLSKFQVEIGDEFYSHCGEYGKWKSPHCFTVNLVRFAECPKRYRGKWSVWENTNVCSKPCGGGLLLHIRECLFSPCKGMKFQYRKACNTHHCHWTSPWEPDVDCFIGSGVGYRGTVSTTVSGKKCQNWNSNSPHNHFYWHEGLGIDLSRPLCRNPSARAHRAAPWCFTEDENMRWEYCSIPRCSYYEGQVEATFVQQKPSPCVFPAVDYQEHPNSCFSISNDSLAELGFAEDSKVCQTVSKTLGLCSSKYMGMWSGWEVWDNQCSKSCGGGQIVFKRHCRYEPCTKSQPVKYMSECNTQLCPEELCFKQEKAYLGQIATSGGKTCLHWDLGLHPPMVVVPSPENQNYCRNPTNGTKKAPWCFIESKNNSRQVGLCDLVPCFVEGEEVPIVTTGENKNSIQNCLFPFLKDGEETRSCEYSSKLDAYYCGIGKAKRDVLDEDLYGICPEYAVGIWSQWVNYKCSRPCDGGKMIRTRTCRLSPCSGNDWEESIDCNTEKCDNIKGCFSEPQDITKSEYGVRGCSDTSLWYFVEHEGDGEFYACHLPFKYNSATYYKCITASPPTESTYSIPWCATSNFIETGSLHWGYCIKNHIKGLFNDEDRTLCSNSCTLHTKRFCYSKQCQAGHDWSIRYSDCSDERCQVEVSEVWGAWSTCDQCHPYRTRHRSCKEPPGFKPCQGDRIEVERCQNFNNDKSCWKSLASTYLNDTNLKLVLDGQQPHSNAVRFAGCFLKMSVICTYLMVSIY